MKPPVLVGGCAVGRSKLHRAAQESMCVRMASSVYIFRFLSPGKKLNDCPLTTGGQAGKPGRASHTNTQTHIQSPTISDSQVDLGAR